MGKKKRLFDAGWEGDCGFMAIICSLMNATTPPFSTTLAVKLMRCLLGAYWSKEWKSLPKEDSVQMSYHETDPGMPKEDVSLEGVYMQDKDINALVHLLDLEEVKVDEQLFSQYPPWGKMVREGMKWELEMFWSCFPALRGKKKAELHCIYPVHFQAVLWEELIVLQENKRPSFSKIEDEFPPPFTMKSRYYY